MRAKPTTQLRSVLAFAVVAVALFALFMLRSAVLFRSTPSVPVRDFLHANQQESASYGAYAYVVFITRPDGLQRKRYAQVCAAYLRNLEEAAPPRPTLAVVYWLLDTSSPPSRTGPPVTCMDLVSHYDYVRSKDLAAAAGKLQSLGPVLVATRIPFYSGRASSTEVLVLDMSDFAPQDFDRAFRIWNDRISREPEVWSKGFDLVKVREAFRNLLLAYGGAILNVVKPGQ